MTSLNDNRPLMYALLSVGLFSVALASNMLPDVSNQFEIIIFPADFRIVVQFFQTFFTRYFNWLTNQNGFKNILIILNLKKK